MLAKGLILAGAAGLVAAGAAVPADAQYYPPPPPQQSYPQQQYYPPQQQARPGGIAGAIIDSATGNYGRYPYGNYGYNQYGNQARMIDSCARAVEQRLNGYAYNWYGNYNYRRYRPSGRVEGITRIERKDYGLKVWGVASSGYGGYQGWNQPNYGTYGYGAGADLRFECKAYRSGGIRGIEIKRRDYNWRGY